MSRLQVGDKAPEFRLSNQDGEEVSLSDFRGKKVLVYFYPKAATPGCTDQACNVRDAWPELRELDLPVVGVSPDPPEKQKKFAEEQELPFPLLSDEDHSTAEAYGAWGEKSMYGRKSMGIIRSSFLIDEGGEIIEAWYKIKPKDTSPKAVSALKG